MKANSQARTWVDVLGLGATDQRVIRGLIDCRISSDRLSVASDFLKRKFSLSCDVCRSPMVKVVPRNRTGKDISGLLKHRNHHIYGSTPIRSFTAFLIFCLYPR